MVDITDATLSIVGSGATIQGAGPESFKVGSGANVTVRGLTFDLTNGNLRCDPVSGGQPASITLKDVDIRGPSSGGAIRLSDCKANFERVDVRIGSNPVVSVQNGSSVIVDRSFFRSTNDTQSGGSFAVYGRSTDVASSHLEITNSVFFDVWFLPAFDTQGLPSTVRLGFNTHVSVNATNVYLLDCSNTGNAAVTIEKNALKHPFDPIHGSGCATNNNVVYFQTSTIPGSNIFANPLFVDVSTEDLRLRSDSPAVDAALESGAINTNHDFLGHPRPNGTAKDIGAFEFVH